MTSHEPCPDCVRHIERAEKAEAALRESCREEMRDGDRCNKPAEFLLWGKLFERKAFGPRCYDHAVRHTDHSMPSRVDQWAVMDLRAGLDKAALR